MLLYNNITKKKNEEDANIDSDETLDETVLSDDDEELEPIVKEVLAQVRDKPNRGRPKGSLNKPVQAVAAVKIPKERVKKPKKTVYVMEQDGELEPVAEKDIIKEDIKLTKKQTKALEAENLKSETEKQLGKKVKITRKGTVDNSGVKPRTKAQIVATKRLVENNRLRRLKQTESKKEQTKELIKSSVEKVIHEKLSDTTEVVKPKPKPVKIVPDYKNEFC